MISAPSVATGDALPDSSTASSPRTARDDEFSSYMAARQAALLRTAYLLTGERAAAEDLLQTALAKLYLSWDKVRDRGALDGYVRRIMVNEHNSLWRRAWKHREHSSDEVPEHGRHDAYDEGSDLWAVIQTLPRRTRAVIVLRYYEELSEAEIAEALGISRGTVKSQASRGLALLRERTTTTTTPREEER